MADKSSLFIQTQLNPRIYGLRKEITDLSNNVFNISGSGKDVSKDDTSRNKKLHEYLFTDDSKTNLVLGTPKVLNAIHKEDFTEDFHISEEELKYYCDGFASALKDQAENTYTKLIDENIKEADLAESALDDSDVKLSLYRSFKSLYDKWISTSKPKPGKQTPSGYFYNQYGQNDNRTLFEHFRFINRAGEDVGGEAVIDVSYISNLANTGQGQGPTQSLYNCLGTLLSKNNFDFWPLPSDVDLFTNSIKKVDVEDMFRANDFVTDKKAGPMFNCVFIGGSSRQVADVNQNNNLSCKMNNNNYNDDSFDIGDPQQTDLPKEFLNPDKGVVSFKVRYGQEAQNHFTSVDLDQVEFKETQESLEIIDALTNPKTGNSPSSVGKGNNMYDAYLTRSYNCSVTGLGNMSISPLMYFTLENVPMFRGTYLITNVSHEISPHNHVTKFSGMRQPRITIPVVTDALSILDIALTPDEAFEGQLGDLGQGTPASSSNVIYDSNGKPFIPNKDKVDLSKIKGANSAYVISVKSPGNAGNKKQCPGTLCKQPSTQLRSLPYYTANDTFDIVGTKVPDDLFAKQINTISGLSTLEKRITWSVGIREQGGIGRPIRCFGNNCYGFNVEGNFSGMDKLVKEGRVLNTFCWVDSSSDRVFPQFSSYLDSVEIFAKNQVRARWIDMTFKGYGWWNGNKHWMQTLASAPAELNLYGNKKDGSLINGMKETDSEQELAAKFVIAYEWNWHSAEDKGQLVASIKSLKNPNVTTATKLTFDIWNASAKYFS